MIRARTTAAIEADLAALKAAAERAGTALACLFSSAEEFEAEIIRVRRAQGAFPPPRRQAYVRKVALTAVLVVALLVI